MLWYCHGRLKRRIIWDTARYKGFHMPLKACAYRKKGMMLLPRGFARGQFVRGVCGTKTRAYLVQVSDQRGTCLVEKPAKGCMCL